jgi:hypothetical protein
MEVRYTTKFIKNLNKNLSQQQANNFLKKLNNTKLTDGDFIAIVGNVVLKEKRLDSFRFYFIFNNEQILMMTEDEFRQSILLFIDISKKNNQQKVIDKLKKDLKNTGFKL